MPWLCRHGAEQRTLMVNECDALSEGLRFLGVLSTGGPRRLRRVTAKSKSVL
jgi:hypothetical protein